MLQQGGMGFEEINLLESEVELPEEGTLITKKVIDAEKRAYKTVNNDSHHVSDDKGHENIDSNKARPTRAAEISKAFSNVRERNASGASEVVRQGNGDSKWTKLW